VNADFVSTVMASEALNQMNTYRSFVSLLVDPTAKDENKLKETMNQNCVKHD